MNFDALGGLCCLIVAGCVFLLHSLTGKDFPAWIKLPFYVRIGVVSVGVTVFLHSVDLFTLALSHGDPDIRDGHLNIWGAMAYGSFAYLSTACLTYAVNLRLARHRLISMRREWLNGGARRG